MGHTSSGSNVVNATVTFGQGSVDDAGKSSFMGAGFGMEAIPGMYDGRPDRYFDNKQDVRNGNASNVIDSQLTRDVCILH